MKKASLKFRVKQVLKQYCVTGDFQVWSLVMINGHVICCTAVNEASCSLSSQSKAADGISLGWKSVTDGGNNDFTCLISEIVQKTTASLFVIITQFVRNVLLK